MQQFIQTTKNLSALPGSSSGAYRPPYFIIAKPSQKIGHFDKQQCFSLPKLHYKTSIILSVVNSAFQATCFRLKSMSVSDSSTLSYQRRYIQDDLTCLISEQIQNKNFFTRTFRRLWGFAGCFLLVSLNKSAVVTGCFSEWHSRGQRFDPAYLHQMKQSPEKVAVFFWCGHVSVQPLTSCLSIKTRLRRLSGVYRRKGQRFDPAYLHQTCWKACIPRNTSLFVQSDHLFLLIHLPLSFRSGRSLSARGTPAAFRRIAAA